MKINNRFKVNMFLILSLMLTLQFVSSVYAAGGAKPTGVKAEMTDYFVSSGYSGYVNTFDGNLSTFFDCEINKDVSSDPNDLIVCLDVTLNSSAVVWLYFNTIPSITGVSFLSDGASSGNFKTPSKGKWFNLGTYGIGNYRMVCLSMGGFSGSCQLAEIYFESVDVVLPPDPTPTPDIPLDPEIPLDLASLQASLDELISINNSLLIVITDLSGIVFISMVVGSVILTLLLLYNVLQNFY